MTTARSLDQFYTRRDVAAHCFNLLRKRIGDDWHWVEPSAGDGAFADTMPFPRTLIDLAPMRPDIEAIDFLAWRPDKCISRIAVVGNPPFGKNASLARRFFDHAASFADVVAFILPRTFQKPHFVSRLHPMMHLVSEQVLPEASFVFDGSDYAVPTVFQIWEKRYENRRAYVKQSSHPDFSFVVPQVADFAFQRVGARAGLVSKEGLRKSPQSHYFLKSHVGSRILFDRLNGIDWEPIKHCTAGNPSIGKGELIESYGAALTGQ